MRPMRLLMTGLVALGLAPGTFVRSAVEPEPEIAAARPQIARVDVPATDAGSLRVEGVWEVSSADRRVGGFSALTATGPEELVAISDAAQIARIALREGEPSRIRIADPARPVRPPSGVALETKGIWDVESLARDPASGSLWLGFESSNVIERYTPDFRMAASVQPAAMRDWSANSGPEAMARLGDGRFLVVEEGTPDMFGSDHRGLLFAGDPTEGHRPVQFRLASPDGYRPVDAAALSGGKVLVLLRRVVWGVPPRFESALMLVDVDAIEQGARVEGTMLGALPAAVPGENYEGLAIGGQTADAVTLWLISDDNFVDFQRTLIVKLRFDTSRGARE